MYEYTHRASSPSGVAAAINRLLPRCIMLELKYIEIPDGVGQE
jgi:hypothetical protein